MLKRRRNPWYLGLAGVLGSALGAAAAQDNAVFCADLERIGTPAGLQAVAVAGADGGTVASLATDAWIGWDLRLPAGAYTFAFRAFAPAGDQDALFVTIGGRRQRFTVPIGHWGHCAMSFSVPADGSVGFLVEGQEPGVQVDRCAVLKGTIADSAADLLGLPPTAPELILPPSSLANPVRPCRLAEFPPLGDPGAGRRQGFELPLRQGVTGQHAVGQGPWGQHLVLALPDGRFEMPCAGPEGLASRGTVEWWVRPRPATNAWRDQGWHYFLHGVPAPGSSVRLDLSRHVAGGLALSLAAVTGTPCETVQVDTESLDPEAWHHLLVSWDCSADPQFLWLLVDGKGRRLQFPKRFAGCAFERLVFGNTPPGDDLPFLPMDGAIDQITVSTDSVAERLAP